VGDKVAHVSCGDGVVIGNDGLCITVRFPRPPGASKGHDAVGIYDANWFRVNPKYLFHRDTTPQPGGA